MKTAQDYIKDLECRFYSPYEGQQVAAYIARLSGERAVSHCESTVYLAWLAWLGHSASEDSFDDFERWVNSDRASTGSGTTADQVQNFYDGFRCAHATL